MLPRLHFGTIAVVALLGFSQFAAAGEKTNALVIEVEGKAVVSRASSEAWDPAYTNQVLFPKDRLRTFERSRAVVQLSDLSTLRLGQTTLIQIPEERGARRGINLLRGLLYYFHRDKPGTLPVKTPSAYAVVLGTEFTVAVAEDGATRLTVIEGAVEMTNQFGRLSLKSGEAALAEPGKAPVKTPSIEAVNIIQWVLYYPGVLNLDELQLTVDERNALAESLNAYRNGDLRAAVDNYPEGRQPISDAEKIYFAALLLTVGQVGQAEGVLGSLSADGPDSKNRMLADALRTVVAAVKFDPSPLAGEREKTSASVLLAESYYQQSRSDLNQALALALRATEGSTNFGFAWARVAELQFSFGRIPQAREALERSLRLAPRNAQAVALKGFLLAAENEIDDAIVAFNEAIALDGALGNAWLGRGLCRIRRGDADGGREDLQVAATIEPQRAILRSYLGKAFANEGDKARARTELGRAKEIDPNDPTAWLYSALLNREFNRVNQAVRDLEHSQELNENRRVYRSGLLLDQDKAVRGVNLAGIYADAGMFDWSAREAGQAVQADPANYSAHLFLGDSYQRLRDPRRINQRFEAAAVNEYLLANLLSPAGAGTLAQSVTQNEYSKLYEADGLGVSSATEYTSNGDWLQSGAQYGTYRDFSYALSGFYRSDNGQRRNHDFEQRELSLQLKYDVTPRDSIYFRVIEGEAEGGDLLARYDPRTANRTLRVKERQEPLLLGGYHREWAPGVHTLALAGWLKDDLEVFNRRQETVILGKNSAGTVTDVLPITIQQHYRTEPEIFTGELQQLWQQEKHTLIVGGRYQTGQFDPQNRHTNASFIFPFLFPQDTQRIQSDFERKTVYGYYHWQPVVPLLLVAGLSYDSLQFPKNFRYAPLATGEDETDLLAPKGGLIWTATDRTTIRAGYAQSLGGAGLEQSFRLEPTQVAGFDQAFRSIIPESVAGANSAAKFETWGVSWERKIWRNTYIGLSGEWLRSEVDRMFGVYDFLQPFRIARSLTRERLDYDEQSLLFTVNQLVGDEWAFGLRYRLSHAELQGDFLDVPNNVLTAGGFRPRTEVEGMLHQLNLLAIYNHPSGFFGQVESLWTAQVNHGYSGSRPGDDFWQFNLFIGYRMAQRRVEARVGLLNLAGQDYRLNPLNLTAELPRERTFVTSLKFNF